MQVATAVFEKASGGDRRRRDPRGSGLSAIGSRLTRRSEPSGAVRQRHQGGRHRAKERPNRIAHALVASVKATLNLMPGTTPAAGLLEKGVHAVVDKVAPWSRRHQLREGRAGRRSAPSSC